MTDQLANRRRQVGGTLDPADFVPFVIDQRQPLIGGRDGEGADRRDTFVALTILGR